MIDYSQIWLTDKSEIERLWAHPLLYSKNMIEKTSKITGEIYQTITKEFEDITFRREPHYFKELKVNGERLVIGFKPHYWFNGNKHNANDFSAENCIKTIVKFIEIFEIEDYNKYSINNLEYGLNFLLPGYGKELIGHNIYHGTIEFRLDKDLRFSKRAHSFDKSGKPNVYSYAKLYSKGFQYPEYCSEDTLRFEMGTKKSGNVNNLGIYHIGDLLNIQVYFNLKKSLKRNSQKLLIVDQQPNMEILNKRDQNRLIKHSNSTFWFEALQYERNATFNDRKNAYLKLLDKTGFNVVSEFRKVINGKLEILLTENRKDLPPQINLENRKDSPLDKVGILTVLNKRLCIVTGYDISMQKPDSTMLSNTGLKYLEKYNPKAFEELKRALLTGRENKYETNTYLMMSKQIRNRNNSRPPNDPNQGLLF